MTITDDQRYLALITKHIETCKLYKPKFGQGGQSGLTLPAFRELYGTDPFYAWFGLDHPLVYAAHKAAGGITSIYRQIGIGSEVLFRQLLKDRLALNDSQVTWSYSVQISSARLRILKLDARISISDIDDIVQREVFQTWLAAAAAQTGVAPEVSAVLKGAVFEVRQGYKSKDSKRQNADIANAASAYAAGYLPVVVILSNQIDNDVALRYAHERWLVLRGNLTGTSLTSTYTFMQDVIGYDLAGFFARNADYLRTLVIDVMQTLLSPDE